MKDEGEIESIGEEFNTSIVKTKNVISLKPIILKSTIMDMVSLIDISAEIFKVYLFSALNLESLAASSLIQSITRFVIDPLNQLVNQNTVFISQKFGKIKNISTDTIVAAKDADLINDYKSIGTIIHEAWLVGTLVCIPSFGILFFIEPILNHLGISEDISQFVSEYFLPVIPSLPLLVAINVNERFFTAVDQEKWLIPYRLGMAIFSIGLNLLLIPELKATGGGLAVLIEALTAFSLTTTFIAFKNNLKPFGLLKYSGLSLQRIKEMLKQGVPLTLALLAFTGTNFTISIFIGRMDKLRLAVQQTAHQFYGITVTLAHGINEAGNRLVGQSIGACLYREMRYYGNFALMTSPLIYSVLSAGYNILPLQISRIFIDQSEISGQEDLLRYTFLLMGVARLFSVIQDAAILNLAGMEDTFLASAANMMATLALVLPLTVISNFFTNFDLYGINSAMLIGVVVSSSIIMKHWICQSNLAVNHNHFDPQQQSSNAKLTQLNWSNFWCKKKLAATEQATVFLTEDGDEVKNKNFN